MSNGQNTIFTLASFSVKSEIRRTSGQFPAVFRHRILMSWFALGAKVTTNIKDYILLKKNYSKCAKNTEK